MIWTKLLSTWTADGTINARTDTRVLELAYREGYREALSQVGRLRRDADALWDCVFEALDHKAGT